MKPTFSAIPTARFSAKTLNTRVIIITTIVLLAALMGPLAMVVALTSVPPPAQAPPRQVSLQSGLAAIVARDYLDAKPTKVPVASGVNPSFGVSYSHPHHLPKPLPHSTLYLISSTSATTTHSKVMIDRFITSVNGNILIVAVPMKLTSEGPVVATDPSFMPYIAAPTGQFSPFTYGRQKNILATPPPGFQPQLLAWAKAFASNNSSELQIIANTSQPYHGLGGFKVVGTPSVVSVVPATGKNEVVRVQLTLAPKTDPYLTLYASYDLLVTPYGNLPKISAWAPAGTAASNTPLTPSATSSFSKN